MKIDPVCHMEVDEKTSAAKSDYEGETYHFCSVGCKKVFDKNPGLYLHSKEQQSVEIELQLPQRGKAIVQSGFSGLEKDTSPPFQQIVLPIQGMSCASCVDRIQTKLNGLDGVISASVNLATESATIEYKPLKVNQQDFKNAIESIGYKLLESQEGIPEDFDQQLREKEFKKLQTDFWISFTLTVPIIMISMLLVRSSNTWNYILCFLTTPILFWCGRRFLVGFWSVLRHFSADMNTLVAVGTFTAYAYSII